MLTRVADIVISEVTLARLFRSIHAVCQSSSTIPLCAAFFYSALSSTNPQLQIKRIEKKIKWLRLGRGICRQMHPRMSRKSKTAAEVEN
jgi:hypothetical protein